jgi:hypothetical protein
LGSLSGLLKLKPPPPEPSSLLIAKKLLVFNWYSKPLDKKKVGEAYLSSPVNKNCDCNNQSDITASP